VENRLCACDAVFESLMTGDNNESMIRLFLFSSLSVNPEGSSHCMGVSKTLALFSHLISHRIIAFGLVILGQKKARGNVLLIY